MHSKQIQAEINHLMETLNEQYEAVNNREGLVPRIEIDLMMTTLRNLYEQLHHLGKKQERFTAVPLEESTRENSVTAPSAIEKEEVYGNNNQPAEAAAVTTEVNPVLPEPIAEPVIEQPVVVKEVIVHKETVVLKEEVPAAPKPEKFAPAMTRKAVQTAGLFDEVTTVAETYSVKTTLHDKMSSGKTDRSVADNLQSKPLTDLKKSIGINEKFVFVNELFEGNHNLFNQSIEKLNAFTAYDEARRHLLEELAGQMNWNKESKAFSELSDLVRRRFTSL